MIASRRLSKEIKDAQEVSNTRDTLTRSVQVIYSFAGPYEGWPGAQDFLHRYAGQLELALAEPDTDLGEFLEQTQEMMEMAINEMEAWEEPPPGYCLLLAMARGLRRELLRL
jgi:hypothetical protein